MNVKFYYNEYPPNRVDKNIDKDNPVLTLQNVRFKDDNSLNIVSPVLVLSPDNELNSWRDIVESAKFNYFYIPKFERFYFVRNITTDNGLILIEGKCDVLTSFMDDILASTQFVVRSQSQRSTMLHDDKLPIRSDHKYFIKNLTLDGSPVDVVDKSCSSVLMITEGVGGTVVSSK